MPFLGDSAYPLLSYLMTPKLNEPEGTPFPPQITHHVRVRSSVERCIGVFWKGDGDVLQAVRKERALHYMSEVAGKI